MGIDNIDECYSGVFRRRQRPERIRLEHKPPQRNPVFAEKAYVHVFGRHYACNFERDRRPG